MSLYLKTITAFSLSLAVTILLACCAYREARQIESTLHRLALLDAEMESVGKLKGSLTAHQLGVTGYLLTADESLLSQASLAIKEAEGVVVRLLQNSNAKPWATDRVDNEPTASDQEERQLLTQFRSRLLDAEDVVEPILAIERSGREEEAEASLHQDYEVGYIQELHALLAELKSKASVQFEAGKRRHELAVASLRNDALFFGLIGGCVAVLAVAFLKRSLDEIAEANRRETAANAAKSTFLANMSHEIRTPLNGILGFARLLTRNPTVTKSPDAVEHVSTILRSGGHLLNVINDILDLSKVEAGQLKCTRTLCEVLALMEEVISLVRVRAVAKSVALDFTWMGLVPESIQTDPVRFKQIVVNLVGNAIKFTEAGRVTVVAWLDESAGRSDIVVEVTDTGIGIGDVDQVAIFKPFFQTDDSLTREYEGTGLGLAISKRMAELLGGGIAVTSQLGEGSTFTVRIDAGPMADVEMRSYQDAVKQSLTTPAMAPPLMALPGCVVLVVDDGDTNRALVKVIAEQVGATVLEATNGLKGVETALSEEVDAILMDVQMPVMDGLTAASTLRARGFSKPIIALTAHAMSGDRARCLEAGCSGYLAKPLDPDDLVRELAEQIDVTPLELGNSAVVDDAEPETPKTETPKPGTPGKTIQCSLPMENSAFLGIAQRFAGDLIARLKIMHEQYHCGNWEELGDSAHWLKGSGGTAGFHCFTEPASSLHSAAADRNSARVEQALQELRSLVDRLPPECLEEAAVAAR